MEVWADLKKIYGCTLCGATVKPVKTVMESKTHTKADLCEKCWNDTKDYPKFVEGLKTGEIEVTNFI
jgi:hypothetical protein